MAEHLHVEAGMPARLDDVPHECRVAEDGEIERSRHTRLNSTRWTSGHATVEASELAVEDERSRRERCAATAGSGRHDHSTVAGDR